MRSLKKLIGANLLAVDGVAGRIEDIYFDDAQWAVRYLVVKVGAFLSAHRVVVEAAQVSLSSGKGDASVNLNLSQVADLPRASSFLPVCLQMEMQSTYASASYGASRIALEEWPSDRYAEGDPHLRSFIELQGYCVEPPEGVAWREKAVGVINDFLVDEASWTLTQAKITRKIWPFSRRVFVPASLICHIDWERQTVVLTDPEDSGFPVGI